MVKIIRAGATTPVNQVDDFEVYSAVAGLADGGYVVVYNSGSNFSFSETYETFVTYQDVYAARFNAAGQLVGSFKLDQLDAPSRYLMKPDVVALSGGGFAIAYMEESLGYYGGSPYSGGYQEYDRYRTYNADGSVKFNSFYVGSSDLYSSSAQRIHSDVTLA